MIVATRIRKGMLIKLDGELYRVHDFYHSTPGKGIPCMQTKLKNLRTGSISDFRFKPGDKVERATLEMKPFEYLYQDGNSYVFMDSQTYEQVHLDPELVGDSIEYMKPNQAVTIEFHDEKPLGVTLPKTVDLKVTHTEPGLKSATVTNVGKPVTLETGLIITAPQFIDIGDIIRVDTEEGGYVERVKA